MTLDLWIQGRSLAAHLAYAVTPPEVPGHGARRRAVTRWHLITTAYAALHERRHRR